MITVKSRQGVVYNPENHGVDFDFVDYNFDGERKYPNSQEEEDFFYAQGENIEPEDFFNVEAGVDLGGDFFDAEGNSKKEARKQKRADKKADKDKKVKDPNQKSKVGGFLKKFSEKFKTFVGNLKAKKNARKLKRDEKRKGKYIDVIPPVNATKDANGTVVYKKTNPDNSVVTLSQNDVKVAEDGKTYDKADLGGSGNLVVDNGNLVKLVDEKDVVTLNTEDGEALTFKKEDVVEKGQDEKKGMSTGVKIAIGVGIVVVLGVIAYFVFRKKATVTPKVQ